MSSENHPHKLTDTMMVSSMVQQAETEVLLDLCLRLAERLGIREIDGLPLVDWFQREKVARMDGMLIDLEDTSPAIAAQFQTIIDACKKRLDKKSKGES